MLCSTQKDNSPRSVLLESILEVCTLCVWPEPFVYAQVIFLPDSCSANCDYAYLYALVNC